MKYILLFVLLLGMLTACPEVDSAKYSGIPIKKHDKHLRDAEVDRNEGVDGLKEVRENEKKNPTVPKVQTGADVKEGLTDDDSKDLKLSVDAMHSSLSEAHNALQEINKQIADEQKILDNKKSSAKATKDAEREIKKLTKQKAKSHFSKGESHFELYKHGVLIKDARFNLHRERAIKHYDLATKFDPIGYRGKPNGLVGKRKAKIAELYESEKKIAT